MTWFINIKNYKKILSIGILIGLFFLIVKTTDTQSQTEPTLTLVSNAAQVNAGDEIEIRVNIDNAPPFANWQTLVRFDNSKVSLVSQSQGDFSTFVPDSRSSSDIASSGEVRAGGFGFVDNSGGSGSLAVLTFEATSDGTALFSTAVKGDGEPFGSVLSSVDGSETIPFLANNGTVGVTVGSGDSPGDPAPQPEDPVLNITSPQAGASLEGPDVTVTYSTSGDLPEGAHAHFRLNNEDPIIDMNFAGSLTISGLSPGNHVLTGWLVNANHEPIAGTETSVSFSVTSAPQAEPAIALVSDVAGLDVGDNVTVTVNLSDAPPFSNWQTLVKFDNTKLRLTSQSAGTFETFVPDSRSINFINSTGEIRSGGFGLSDNSGGSGTLAVFTFEAVAQGATEITTESKSSSNVFGNQLIDSAGTEILPNVAGNVSLEIEGDVEAPGERSAVISVENNHFTGAPGETIEIPVTVSVSGVGLHNIIFRLTTSFFNFIFD